jgi:UDP-hydrolysing UDP-N-acetyl-D-glucosamine 2-epimerase
MNKMRICVVTAARSEYGHMKWLIHDLAHTEGVELQLVVTGGHLSVEQGHTVDEIKADGMPVSKIVDARVQNGNPKEITDTMGRMATGFSEAFAELKPDVVVVLGDRYELLPICSAAFMQRIPIAHLSGGDVTEGALDDGVRNAVTMLATYHFPSTKPSADNIARMRGENKNIYITGEASLEAFNRIDLLSRAQVADNLDLKVSTKWVLCTFHSVTRESVDRNLTTAHNLIESLLELRDKNYQVVITKANADLGGKQLNDFYEQVEKEYPDFIKLYSSLGQLRYMSFMKQVELVIGNSSSGIVETPFHSISTVNIGDRQKGRHQCSNIFQCDNSKEDITGSINRAILIQKRNYPDRYYWGDGKTAQKVIKVLTKDLYKNIGGGYEIIPEFLFPTCNTIEHGFGEIADSTARQTLYRILESRNSSSAEISDVYVPDYICGCVYEAINRAGMRIHYYHIDESFYQNFDYKALVSTIKKESDCKKTALIIVNYFATLDCVETVRIVKELNKDLTVILDNVQSLFDMRIDSGADYQFTSLRKWIPVPDGSAVKRIKGCELKPMELIQSTSAVESITAGFLKNYKNFPEIRDKDYLVHFEKGEELINSSWNVKVSSFTETILDNIDFDTVALQRRNNAYSLCEAIIKNKGYKDSAERIIRLLAERPSMVPMFVPVFIDNRDYVRHELMNNNIFCPIHWPDGKNKDLAVRELSLVIDQRYDENDMKKIADVLNSI